MNRPKPNVVWGWRSPMLSIRAEAFCLFSRTPELLLTLHAAAIGATSFRGPVVRLALRAVVVGFLRWLWWCLPWYRANENGESVGALGFYFSIIRGPYVCVFCEKATTQGPNETHNEPAYCARCEHRLAEWSQP